MLSERIEAILPLLAAPNSHEPLRLKNDRLVSASGRQWPIQFGGVNFLEEPVIARSVQITHGMPPKAVDLIQSAGGWVLNLSAGGSETRPDNVVELEWGLFRNTDVSADAHDLPFADAVFSGVVCMNSFEHYRQPDRVAAEIRRVLKPGGRVYILTAFSQPFHMQPHHYFNATPSGLRQWFSEFSVVECGSTEFHNGILAAQWLANSMIWALERERPRDEIRALTLGELSDAWAGEWPESVKAAHTAVGQLPIDLRDNTAQAVELLAVKNGYAPSIAASRRRRSWTSWIRSGTKAW